MYEQLSHSSTERTNFISIISTGFKTGVKMLSTSAIDKILIRRLQKPGRGPSRFLTASQLRLEEGGNDSNDDDSDFDPCIRCKICRRWFTSEGRLAQHSQICHQCENNVLSKTILWRALSLVERLIQSRDIKVLSLADEKLVDTFDTSGTVIGDARRGWALRDFPKLETSKYVQLHIETLQDLFDKGAADKAYKMSSSAMREHIIRKVGDKFDIPSEMEIKKAIQAMYSQIVQIVCIDSSKSMFRKKERKKACSDKRRPVPETSGRLLPPVLRLQNRHHRLLGVRWYFGEFPKQPTLVRERLESRGYMVDKLRELMLLGNLSPQQKIELDMVLESISRIVMSI